MKQLSRAQRTGTWPPRVGHTDNQGKRLLARGVASLAPVASNGSEAGRARNRRVELVEQ
jgi:flagellar motor protein MotB